MNFRGVTSPAVISSVVAKSVHLYSFFKLFRKAVNTKKIKRIMDLSEVYHKKTRGWFKYKHNIQDILDIETGGSRYTQNKLNYSNSQQ